MSDNEDAARVRDIIADDLLDGRRVISVGLGKNSAGETYVGVTATQAVKLPPLPADLAHVQVQVNVNGQIAEAH